MLANHKVEHVHPTFAEQNAGKPCILHPHSPSCARPVNADLGVFGTPCDPFSLQRGKRFHDGSVKQHALYSVTFTDALNFLLDPGAPKAVIMEQVEGFNEPESDSESEIPMNRQVWKNEVGPESCNSTQHV